MPPKVTPAARVERLRRRKGSHEKLATALKGVGMHAATRQRVINWEKGAGITAPYREALAQLDGSSPDDFDVGKRAASGQTSLQREVAALRGEVAALRASVDSLAQAFAFVLTRGQAAAQADENLDERSHMEGEFYENARTGRRAVRHGDGRPVG